MPNGRPQDSNLFGGAAGMHDQDGRTARRSKPEGSLSGVDYPADGRGKRLVLDNLGQIVVDGRGEIGGMCREAGSAFPKAN